MRNQEAMDAVASVDNATYLACYWSSSEAVRKVVREALYGEVYGPAYVALRRLVFWACRGEDPNSQVLQDFLLEVKTNPGA